jgi:uncharacterized membrane protein (DUF4010 family)
MPDAGAPAGAMAAADAFRAVEWPYLEMLTRFALALALGLLIGLERERRKKEAGLRTFGFVALLGGVSGALGDGYAYIALGLTGMLTVFLNWQEMRAHEGTELTTSAAMLVTCLAGILCGKGHTLTPAAVMVGTTALLAWKDRLQGFSVGLTEDELRSALLLAILAIVIYPALPAGTIGPWGLVEPRMAWATVILIAGIGFVNYVLWKNYGMRGIAIAGFLGGLVNSSVTVNELAARAAAQRSAAQLAASYQGIMLATAAMTMRNAVILALLAPLAAARASASYALMLAASLVYGRVRMIRAREAADPAAPGENALVMPFSLWSAIKFGVIFLALHVFGAVTQRYFGDFGFYAVSIVGGMVSSASSVAAAGSLFASNELSAATAATGAVLASIASVCINLPFVLRARQQTLTARVAVASGVIALLGLAGILVENRAAAAIERLLR